MKKNGCQLALVIIVFCVGMGSARNALGQDSITVGKAAQTATGMKVQGSGNYVLGNGRVFVEVDMIITDMNGKILYTTPGIAIPFPLGGGGAWGCISPTKNLNLPPGMYTVTAQIKTSDNMGKNTNTSPSLAPAITVTIVQQQ